MPTRIGSLLVIAGPPAAGKTTIADAIATDSRFPTAHLPTDAFHTWISSATSIPLSVFTGH